MQPSVRVSDVEFAARQLDIQFDIKYVVLEPHVRPLRILRPSIKPGGGVDVLEFNTLRDAFEYLVEVCVDCMRILAAA